MTPPLIAFISYLLLLIFGFACEYLIEIIFFKSKKKSVKTVHFTIGRYLYLLLLPILLTYIIILIEGQQLVYIFLIFAFLGTFLEYLLGFFYHRIVGQRLWTYHRYSITSYTSILSIPFWGIGGIFAWLLIKIFL